MTVDISTFSHFGESIQHLTIRYNGSCHFLVYIIYQMKKLFSISSYLYVCLFGFFLSWIGVGSCHMPPPPQSVNMLTGFFFFRLFCRLHCLITNCFQNEIEANYTLLSYFFSIFFPKSCFLFDFLSSFSMRQ